MTLNWKPAGMNYCGWSTYVSYVGHLVVFKDSIGNWRWNVDRGFSDGHYRYSIGTSNDVDTWGTIEDGGNLDEAQRMAAESALRILIDRFRGLDNILDRFDEDMKGIIDKATEEFDELLYGESSVNN